ncbi:MAG: hypothetical protein LUF25_06560, partial [Phascolarctobacterium sp.]|nr:hypothetical protein [Phascolarctobacterium sp.]
QSMDNLSDEDVEHAADLICGLPRKELGYRTPEELFDACLDEIYTALVAEPFGKIQRYGFKTKKLSSNCIRKLHLHYSCFLLFI